MNINFDIFYNLFYYQKNVIILINEK
ncbi:hypothetical protein CY0110_19957 [Crocosphaera chwakensis CCY0110]|uniref:Uncharacterized protein n=1 Tax=Crocosphaera chwakensis CCY0110 TaxID=391612 RepID=A3IJX3_9CHRO|nr:hypothetical protein CY0110_19957 [Crocosphaera chwakensis CCY0110]